MGALPLANCGMPVIARRQTEHGSGLGRARWVVSFREARAAGGQLLPVGRLAREAVRWRRCRSRFPHGDSACQRRVPERVVS
jgi:hypothetical protein